MVTSRFSYSIAVITVGYRLRVARNSMIVFIISEYSTLDQIRDIKQQLEAEEEEEDDEDEDDDEDDNAADDENEEDEDGDNNQQQLEGNENPLTKNHSESIPLR